MASAFHSNLTGKRLSIVNTARIDVDQNSAFLSLPREIRYQILQHVMSYTEPPLDGAGNYSRWISASPGSRRTHLVSSRSPLSYDIRGVFPRLPRFKYLFLICRQIRRELRYLTSNKSRGRPQASLDILVSGYRYHPRWTCVPILYNARKGADLIVTLRIMSGESFWPAIDTNEISTGVVFTLVLIEALQKHLAAVRDREAISIYNDRTLLHTVEFELYDRDQYFRGGLDNVHDAFAKHMTAALKQQGHHQPFDAFIVRSIDPATKTTSKLTTSQEHPSRAEIRS